MRPGTFIPGDVVIAPFPIGGGVMKRCPAIVLKIVPPFADVLVCGLSTQLRQWSLKLDETITSADEDYVMVGLLDGSLIRLGYLTTLAVEEVDGGIGEISKVRLERLLNHLASFLTV